MLHRYFNMIAEQLNLLLKFTTRLILLIQNEKLNSSSLILSPSGYEDPELRTQNKSRGHRLGRECQDHVID